MLAFKNRPVQELSGALRIQPLKTTVYRDFTTVRRLPIDKASVFCEYIPSTDRAGETNGKGACHSGYTVRRHFATVRRVMQKSC